MVIRCMALNSEFFALNKYIYFIKYLKKKNSCLQNLNNSLCLSSMGFFFQVMSLLGLAQSYKLCKNSLLITKHESISKGHKLCSPLVVINFSLYRDSTS